MKTIKEILAECKGEEDFKPHMMYDPKTGKGYKANTYADHVKMDKMGYTHEKPEVKESSLEEGLKTTHVLVDTAQGNKIVSTAAGANAEKNLRSSIASAERPPMNIKDKKTLKIVKLKKPVSDKKASQMMGSPLKESASARARRDAMRAMGRRGKDPADVDITATDDDRKAASKNVLMQIRKASDLPKGGEIEFEGGKKGKISQDDAKKVTKLFTMLKKPQDKAKFQKVISKDLKSIQGLLKRLGR